MRFTEEPKYWFAPDIAGNLALPESEQAQIEIIRPTGFQTQEMKSVVAKREYYENDQPVDEKGNARTPKFKSVSTEVKLDADYILRSCVGRVRNVTVSDSDGKNEREIKSGAELAECRAYGISELVSAICAEVVADKMTDAKKKKSE